MATLEIKLQPSKCYIVLLTVVLVMTLIVTISLSFTWWQKLILFFAIILYCIYFSYFYVFLQAKQSIFSIKLLDEKTNHWLLFTKQGSYQAALRGDSTVTRWVSVLRFQLINARFKRYACVIFPDSLKHEHYQTLLRTISHFFG